MAPAAPAAPSPETAKAPEISAEQQQKTLGGTACAAGDAKLMPQGPQGPQGSNWMLKMMKLLVLCPGVPWVC